MPGAILSSQAPALGAPCPCLAGEVNAVAVTFRVFCLSCDGFARAEQEARIQRAQRKSEYVLGFDRNVSIEVKELYAKMVLHFLNWLDVISTFRQIMK